MTGTTSPKGVLMNPYRPIPALIALALAPLGCDRLSTEELTSQVRASMEKKYSGSGVVIQKFMLTKKGGNEYSGILETREPNGQFTYRVDVIYDGKSFTWAAKQM